MNTVIVRPNCSIGYQKTINTIRAIEMPLWHLVLAKYFNTNIIVDGEADNLSQKELINKILSYNPQKIVILATGSHPSAHIQQYGEANKLGELLVKGGIEIEVYKNLPINPCEYGEVDFSLIDVSKYRSHNWHSWSANCITQPYGSIFTSISCPMHCEFCCVKDFYGNNYEQRSLDSISKDFDSLAFSNISNIKMMDELFVFNPKRLDLICDDIIGRGYHFNIWAYARIDIMTDKMLRKMKEAGINWLCFGIETGSEKIRKEILKGNFDNNKVREVIKMTKDNGINCLGNYMFGFWEDNISTMNETLTFAKELNCEYSNFYATVAYPGSKLYDLMKEREVKLPTDYTQYSQMNENFLPLSTKYLNYKEVLTFRDNAFKSFFTDNKYLKMMKEKFGNEVIEDINKMNKLKIKRNYVLNRE